MDVQARARSEHFLPFISAAQPLDCGNLSPLLQQSPCRRLRSQTTKSNPLTPPDGSTPTSPSTLVGKPPDTKAVTSSALQSCAPLREHDRLISKPFFSRCSEPWVSQIVQCHFSGETSSVAADHSAPHPTGGTVACFWLASIRRCSHVSTRPVGEAARRDSSLRLGINAAFDPPGCADHGGRRSRRQRRKNRAPRASRHWHRSAC